jgi:hypothetical protein
MDAGDVIDTFIGDRDATGKPTTESGSPLLAGTRAMGTWHSSENAIERETAAPYPSAGTLITACPVEKSVTGSERFFGEISSPR